MNRPNANKSNYKSKPCLECGNEFIGHHTALYCSKTCSVTRRDRLYWEPRIVKSHIDYPVSNPDAYVECPICNFRSPDLAGHPKVHGLTQDEYKAKHGPIKSKATHDSMKGDKALSDAGYVVYHVNEIDYKYDSNNEIDKCINFLKP